MKDSIFIFLNKLLNKGYYIFRHYKNLRYTIYFVIIMITSFACINVFLQIKNQRGVCLKTAYFDLVFEGNNNKCKCE